MAAHLKTWRPLGLLQHEVPLPLKQDGNSSSSVFLQLRRTQLYRYTCIPVYLFSYWRRTHPHDNEGLATVYDSFLRRFFASRQRVFPVFRCISIGVPLKGFSKVVGIDIYVCIYIYMYRYVSIDPHFVLHIP